MQTQFGADGDVVLAFTETERKAVRRCCEIIEGVAVANRRDADKLAKFTEIVDDLLGLVSDEPGNCEPRCDECRTAEEIVADKCCPDKKCGDTPPEEPTK